MNCLITGATGFVGSALLAHLQAHAVARQRCGRETPTDAQLSTCDSLIHCAGIAHRAAREKDYQAVNHEGTLRLAKRAAAAGVRRFVFVSSVNAALEEDSYGRWKRRTELALSEAHANDDMSVVCVRPALVYGPGVKGNLARLVGLVQRGMPVPPPGGHRSMISVQDLCHLLRQLADADVPHGSVLVATDGESYSLARLHASITVALGREPGSAKLPVWAWRYACAGLDLMRGRPGSGDSWRRLFHASEYSNSHTRALLSWQPQQCFEDVVDDIVARQCI